MHAGAALAGEEGVMPDPQGFLPSQEGFGFSNAWP